MQMMQQKEAETFRFSVTTDVTQDKWLEHTEIKWKEEVFNFHSRIPKLYNSWKIVYKNLYWKHVRENRMKDNG